MKSTSKFVKVKDLNQITLAFLTRYAKRRAKEIARDKKFPFKVSLDTRRWIVRAESDGSIKLYTPTIK